MTLIYSETIGNNLNSPRKPIKNSPQQFGARTQLQSCIFQTDFPLGFNLVSYHPTADSSQRDLHLRVRRMCICCEACSRRDSSSFAAGFAGIPPMSRTSAGRHPLCVRRHLHEVTPFPPTFPLECHCGAFALPKVTRVTPGLQQQVPYTRLQGEKDRAQER